MKKLDLKSLFVGIVIGIFCVGGAYAATNHPNIEKATYNDYKVFFYNEEIKLSAPLLEVQEEGSDYMKLYVPVREVLEYLNLNVDYDKEEMSLKLTMNSNNPLNIGNLGNFGNIGTAIVSDGDKDAQAIQLMQKTGNWSYVEPLLKDLSDDAIRKVVDIYNSKHQDVAEHKNAEDYIK